MNNERYLFRGMRKGSPSIFLYGDLYHAEDECYIRTFDQSLDSYDHYEVIPETIGQFTGLTDKNGVKVFEGDKVIAILNIHGKESSIKIEAEIVYNSNIGQYQIAYDAVGGFKATDTLWSKYFIEVVGCIHTIN